MPQGHADDAFLKQASDHLHDRFEITHVTLQVMKAAFSVPCGELLPGTPPPKPDHGHDHDHSHHATHPVRQEKSA